MATSEHPSLFRILLALAVLIVLLWAPSLDAAPVDGGRYTCWFLADALRDLDGHGLDLIWSSDLVRPDMQVTEAPGVAEPRQLVEALLAPFGLAVEPAGGVLLVVPADDAAAGLSPHRRAVDAEGVLPIWLDRDMVPVTWTFPGIESGAARALPRGTAFLVLRLDAGALPSPSAEPEAWQRRAFELKTLIVDALAEHEGLEVALDGPRPLVAALAADGLAPYVHGYVHRGEPWRPDADPTGRSWWRVDAERPEEALARLLEGARHGDRVVVFDRVRIDSLHHAFLANVHRLGAGDLEDQPPVYGFDPARVRFFLEPESGDHYLAVYADAGRGEIGLDPAVAGGSVEGLFPGAGAGVDLVTFPGGATLRLGGRSPYYLVRLGREVRRAQHRDVEVEDTELIDPFEVVVKNQAFQDRLLERFESLDVMEYITQVPQYPGADPIVWEHRILQRKGRLTEYLHLGYSRNGVPYPADKLLEGRLFRTEALVQLNPLEIELDETYRYRFLGRERIDGRPTYKIGFEPVRRGSVEDGSYVRGVVWLDRDTHAHHRVLTYQEGLDGTFVSQERTTHYGWIADGGRCFWDWRRRHGSYATTWLGRQYVVETETERRDFRYNRPDRIRKKNYCGFIPIQPPGSYRSSAWCATPTRATS